MTKLLIAEPPLQVLPTLARLIGLNEAVVLQQLHYHGVRSRDDGWVQRSIVDWRHEDFRFWSLRTLKRAFSGLREKGLIETAVVGLDGGGRESKVRVNHDALTSMMAMANLDAVTPPGWPDRSRRSGTTGSRRSGPTGRAKLAGPRTDVKEAEIEVVANAPTSIEKRERARSISGDDERAQA